MAKKQHSKKGKGRGKHGFHVSPVTVLIIAGFIFLVPASVFVIGHEALTVLGGTPSSIAPANVSGASVTLSVNYTGNGTSNGGKMAFANLYRPVTIQDPSSRYAPITAWTNGCWMSYANGTMMPNGTLVPYNGGYYDLQYVNVLKDGKYYNCTQIIYAYNMVETVALGERSGPKENINEIGYNDYVSGHPLNNYVSPFLSQASLPVYYSGINMVSLNMPSDCPNPTAARNFIGALTYAGWAWQSYFLTNYGGQTDTMKQRDDYNYGLSASVPIDTSFQCAVNSSLQPVSWPCNGALYGAGINDSSTAALNTYKHAAAGPVNVTAKVDILANSQAIKGQNQVVDLGVQLKNGSTVSVPFEVDTVSAVVGFSSTLYSETGSYSGLVPNMNPAHYAPASFYQYAKAQEYANAKAKHAGASTANGGGPTISGALNVDNDTNVTFATGGVNGVSASAYNTGHLSGSTITVTTDIPEPIGGANVSSKNIATNFGLPQHLYFNVQNVIQPNCYVDVANAHVTYANEYDSYGALGTGTGPWYTQSHTSYISWPFGVFDKNYACVQNFTFPVTIYAEKTYMAFDSNGKPINISQIVDLAQNSAYLNASASDFNVTYTPPLPPQPSMCELANNFNAANILTWGYVFDVIGCWLLENQAIFWGIAIIVIALIALGIYAKLKPKTVRIVAK